MKVLIVSTNKTKHLIPVVPNGAGFVVSALREAGHQVRFLDLCFEDDEPLAFEQTLEEVSPDVVGFSMRTCRFGKTETPETLMTRRLVELSKSRTKATVVLGGAAFSFDPHTVLAYVGADCGVIGDGESTLLKLLDGLQAEQGGARKVELPGVLWQEDVGKGDPGISKTAPNDIPIPAMDLYDPRYFTWQGAGSKVQTMKIWNLQTRRGCPYSCGNCRISEFEGPEIRRRPVEHILEELAMVKKRGDIKRWFLVDNLFHLPPQHTATLCTELEKQDAKWQWTASACNGLEVMDYELLERMQAVGCDALIADIITAQDDVLHAAGKSFSAADIVTMFTNSKRIGLELFVHVMLGYPGETLQTARQALRLMEQINPPFLVVIVGFAIYKGTKLSRAVDAISIPGDHPFSPSLFISPKLEVAGFQSLIAEYQARHPTWFFAGVFGDPMLEKAGEAILTIRAAAERLGAPAGVL